MARFFAYDFHALHHCRPVAIQPLSAQPLRTHGSLMFESLIVLQTSILYECKRRVLAPSRTGILWHPVIFLVRWKQGSPTA